MDILNAFIHKELHFYKKLTQNTKNLLNSIFLYNLISPIFSIFINAFIFRQSHSFILVALFNAVSYLFVVPAFYLNGLFLKKYQPKNAYTIGLYLLSISTACLIFPQTLTSTIVLITGMFYGLAIGIYWANRNLLTLQLTKSDNRIYFSSLDQTSGTLTSIIIPLFIGWFIILGSFFSLYTPVQGYQMTAMIMLFITVLTGIVTKKIADSPQQKLGLFIPKATRTWNQMRLFQFFLGFFGGGIGFIPVLMILTYIGRENTLGAIQSFSALISVLLTYYVGKTLAVQKRINLIRISFFLALFGAGMFTLSQSFFDILLFIICISLIQPFIVLIGNSLTYDLIENENSVEHHYAYLSDTEIYLNAGRIVGIALFIFLAMHYSNTFSLVYSPLIFAISLLGCSLLANTIHDKQLEKPAVYMEHRV